MELIDENEAIFTCRKCGDFFIDHPNCKKLCNLCRRQKISNLYSSLEWKKLRIIVFKRDGKICNYCGRRAEALDHVVPRCKGGKTTLENLVPACRPCNSKKHIKSKEEFLKLLQSKS